MKYKANSLTLLFLIVCINIQAQKLEKPSKQKDYKASKHVVSAENLGDDGSSKNYGEKELIKITFDNGADGKIWKAKSTGKYYVKAAMWNEEGPYSYEDALNWLWDHKVIAVKSLKDSGKKLLLAAILNEKNKKDRKRKCDDFFNQYGVYPTGCK